jgi:hypothetical protein
MSEETKHKGISRIDSKKTHGWFVRVYKNKKIYSKLFSDIKSKGREKALELALAYRDELIDKLAEIPDEKAEQKKKRKTTRKTSTKSALPVSIKKKYYKRKNTCNVTFRLLKDAAGEASVVTIVGDFNNWSHEAMPMKLQKNGDYVISLELETGKEYHFRYLVDGSRWENDPLADKFTPNEFGENNCVVIV